MEISQLCKYTVNKAYNYHMAYWIYLTLGKGK